MIFVNRQAQLPIYQYKIIDSTGDLLAPPSLFNLSQFFQVVFAAIRAMFQVILDSFSDDLQTFIINRYICEIIQQDEALIAIQNDFLAWLPCDSEYFP